jgi:N-acetylmuramoyl-L-alanine amidase
MRFLTAILLLLVTLAAQADQARVTSVRYMAASDHVRVVVQTSTPVEHRFFSLDNPDRVVLDLKAARFATDNPSLSANPYLHRLRTGIRGEEDLRLVFDLKQKVRPKVFTLPDAAGKGSSLVVEFHDYYGRAKKLKKNRGRPGQQMVAARSKKAVKRPLPQYKAKVDHSSVKEGARISKQLKTMLPKGRDVVIAVDADPGPRSLTFTFPGDVELTFPNVFVVEGP